MMKKILLLVILFTSYVVIQQHIVNDLGETQEQVQAVATEKPKKVKQDMGYPAPPTRDPYDIGGSVPSPYPYEGGAGYPAPQWPTLRPPLPTAFPTQVPLTPTPFKTPDMSEWCELAPTAWFCVP